MEFFAKIDIIAVIWKKLQLVKISTFAELTKIGVVLRFHGRNPQSFQLASTYNNHFFQLNLFLSFDIDARFDSCFFFLS